MIHLSKEVIKNTPSIALAEIMSFADADTALLVSREIAIRDGILNQDGTITDAVRSMPELQNYIESNNL